LEQSADERQPEVTPADDQGTSSPSTYGWYPDPSGRFDHRFWDGEQWTESVSRAGVPDTDPLPAATSHALEAEQGSAEDIISGAGDAEVGFVPAGDHHRGQPSQASAASRSRLPWILAGVAGVIVLILVVAVVALATSGSDDGETNASSADERPTQTTKATTPTTSAKPAGSADPTKILVGTRALDFASAPDGELAVVASGPPDQSGSTPVVISNATDDDVTRVSVAGTARDASGLVVASGESQGVEPETLPSGGTAIGYVYWGGSTPPAGSTLKFEVSSEPSQGDDYEAVLEVTELNRVVANRFGSDTAQLVGTVRNPRSREVTGPIGVAAMCFGADGAPIGTSSTFTAQDTLQAGASASFAIDLFDRPCAAWLVGASGFDTESL
jgi:hypothetical protein